MLIRYMKGEFSGQYNVTVGVEFASKSVTVDDGREVKLQIWDTVRYFISRQAKKHLEPLCVLFIRVLLLCFLPLPWIMRNLWMPSKFGRKKYASMGMNKLFSS